MLDWMSPAISGRLTAGLCDDPGARGRAWSFWPVVWRSSRDRSPPRRRQVTRGRAASSGRKAQPLKARSSQSKPGQRRSAPCLQNAASLSAAAMSPRLRLGHFARVPSARGSAPGVNCDLRAVDLQAQYGYEVSRHAVPRHRPREERGPRRCVKSWEPEHSHVWAHLGSNTPANDHFPDPPWVRWRCQRNGLLPRPCVFAANALYRGLEILLEMGPGGGDRDDRRVGRRCGRESIFNGYGRRRFGWSTAARRGQHPPGHRRESSRTVAGVSIPSAPLAV
jgi:hypothetical protein